MKARPAEKTSETGIRTQSASCVNPGCHGALYSPVRFCPYCGQPQGKDAARPSDVEPPSLDGDVTLLYGRRPACRADGGQHVPHFSGRRSAGGDAQALHRCLGAGGGDRTGGIPGSLRGGGSFDRRPGPVSRSEDFQHGFRCRPTAALPLAKTIGRSISFGVAAMAAISALSSSPSSFKPCSRYSASPLRINSRGLLPSRARISASSAASGGSCR